MRRVYLGIAVVGAVVPIAVGAVFLQKHGLDGAEFLRQLFGTTAGTLAFGDLLISSIAFWAWMAGEARRLEIAHWWLFIAANLLVGLSFALPLFLYVRSGRLARSSSPLQAPA